MVKWAKFAIIPILALNVSAATSPSSDVRKEVVGKIWAGQPVGFAIYATDSRLYLGYYNDRRSLTIASRPIQGGAWTTKTLPSLVTWDSHNLIAIGIDPSGRVHVAANMHATPMTYFVSDRSGDVGTLKRQAVLVDSALEDRVTYPRFFPDSQGELILQFRHGLSGAGDEILYRYDQKKAKWTLIGGTPTLTGEGVRNAYPVGPNKGPDGWFHMTWVWRDTGGAELNHDLSYAKSRDLAHWFKADGAAIKVPIALNGGDIVDPVPLRGGLMNGRTILGFDADRRAMIAYHKYDGRNGSQIFLARFETPRWHIVQASRWTNYRWNFEGSGTTPANVTIGVPFQAGPEIIIPVVREGQYMRFRLEASDLSLSKNRGNPPGQRSEKWPSDTPPPGLVRNAISTKGGGKAFMLEWFTGPVNRDLPNSHSPKSADMILMEQPAVSP